MDRIESHKNARVKEWKKLHSKKGRENSGRFIIEGPHLVEEALNHGIEIFEIIVTENFSIPSNWKVDNIRMYIVTDKVMSELSETETPQGVAAVCELFTSRTLNIKTGQFLLIDGVQDPGNLGTMIRTADSAGISAVILGEGTVDVFNSKVIRSTQGSLFHLPIIKGNLEEWIGKCKDAGVPVFGTALKGAVLYKEVGSIMDQFALIVGNEGSGVKQKWLEQTDQNIYIPIYGKAESLNVAVATGILLYHLKG
ncbi:TrmH family RNA methyltransferase [Anaerobacillus sp. MEB173]|uniref:TrmH family RNA methyltransferase n=1 Tax=Anaerobacillus sp. MEB173 TaxID=3383345 RepID=UPI003F90DD2A